MARLTDAFAAFLFLLLAFARFSTIRSLIEAPMGTLLGVQATIMAGLLVFRRPAKQEAPLRWQLLAWSAALLPLAMKGQSQNSLAWVGLLLQMAGLLVVLWGLWTLGLAFGIAPADRGLVMRGPYRLVRHPIYAGEFLSNSGFLLAHIAPWNLLIWSLIALTFWLRIWQEEHVLGNYVDYEKRVRWRLLPGVW